VIDNLDKIFQTCFAQNLPQGVEPSSYAGYFQHVIFCDQLQDFLLPVKAWFIFLSIVYAASIVYFLKTSLRMEIMYLGDFREFLMYKPSNVVQRNQKWAKIAKRMDSKLEPEWKMAIIEGFEMVEECFFEMFPRGETFEEQLASSRNTLPEYHAELTKVQELHQRIIDDPETHLEYNVAKVAMDTMRSVLKKMKWL